MTVVIPGVDGQKGLELYGGSLDIYLSILRTYTTFTPATLKRLRNVSAATLSDYVVAIHTLKGTCGSIGAEEARKKAVELEELARAGDLAGLQAVNDAFLERIDTLVANINKWLAQNAP